MPSSSRPTPADMATKERTVSIFLKREIDNERKLLTAPLLREKLEAHSAYFKCFLTEYQVDDEEHREITLPRGSPGGLKHVLGIIRAHGGDNEFYININHMPTARCIAIWEACDELDLEPKSAMDRLMGHLCWNVSHDKITPDIMSKIHAVFFPSHPRADDNRRRPWDTLVHQ